MRNMQVRPRLAQLIYQPDVALHKTRLGLCRHPPQAQPERYRPCIHAAARRHPRVLGVLNYAKPHARRRGQSLAHRAILQNRQPVVAHGHCARSLQRCVVVDRFALRSPRGRRNRKHPYTRPALRRLHPASDLWRVVHRFRIRHRRYRSKSACRRRRRSGGNRLLVALARLAQMYVNVD